MPTAAKLHPARVPGREEEALRDLIRAREAVRVDQMRAGTGSRGRCCGTDRFEDGDAWTIATSSGSARSAREVRCAGDAFDARGAVDALVHRRAQLEREIIALLPDSPWSGQTGRLRCLRGLDTLSAVGLCAEVGDVASFRKPTQLMSYLGLVPSETSTGQQRRLGSITKTGSTHGRRLLVEAAWHCRKRPRIGTALTERQEGAT